MIMQATNLALDNTRKRQRRQTAGNLVVNMFQRVGASNNTTVPSTTTTATQQPQPSTPPPATTTKQKPTTGSSTRKKQSTAQPRPELFVAPRGIGPIAEPNENDVLSGRGGRINSHEGNVRFREIVAAHKAKYLDKATKKLEKAHIAAQIVYYIRMLNPPGRFLKEENDGSWYDIGDAKAIKKVGQALREDAKEIRDGDDDQNEDNNEISISKKEKKTKKKDKGESSSDDDVKGEERRKAISTQISPDTTAKQATSKETNASSAARPAPSVNTDTTAAAGTTSASPKSPTTPVLSSASSPRKPVTVVSGRGGKMSSSSRFTTAPTMHVAQSPIPAYQSVEIAPPPAYQPVLPTSAQSYPFYNVSNSFRGSVPRTSGAAAAVMQQEIIDQTLSEFEVPGLPASYPEEAFGLPFHYADHPMAEMSSQLSGLSNSQVSGMSGISALTDPISSISGSGKGDSNLIRALQLDKVRHNWTHAAQHHNASLMATSDTSHLPLQHGSTGFGNAWGNSGPAVRLLAQNPQLLRSSLTMEDINWAGQGYNNNAMLSGVVSRGREGSGVGSSLTGIGSFGSDGSPRMDSMLFSSSLFNSNLGSSNNGVLGGSSRHSAKSGNHRARSQGGDCMSIASANGNSVLSMANSLEDVSTVFSGLDLGSDVNMLD